MMSFIIRVGTKGFFFGTKVCIRFEPCQNKVRLFSVYIYLVDEKILWKKNHFPKINPRIHNNTRFKF